MHPQHDPDTTRKVQLKQLEIMIVLDRIFREQGLTYYLIAGTLLGAVRHQGFTPWDDDLDIFMPRADYDRLLKHGQRLLPESLFLQNYHTDKKCYILFTKVRMNGTVYKEQAAAHLDCHHGVFLDIFPLDAVPDNLKTRKRNAFLIGQIQKIMHQKLGMASQRGNPILRAIRSLIGQCCSIDILGSIIDRIARRYRHANTGLLSSVVEPVVGVEPWIMSPDQYGKPVELEFEGHKFFAPASYELSLEGKYGDFMRLPPEDQRIGCHSICELKL
jgi:lipopolysaccharide cholinephosphotransferase